jgi:hypothetical protein
MKETNIQKPNVLKLILIRFGVSAFSLGNGPVRKRTVRLPRKTLQRQKKSHSTFKKAGMVAGLFMIFVLSAAAYESPAVKALFHSFRNGSTLNNVVGKIPGPHADFDADSDQAARGALKPEDEDKNGDDSLKFKKREYDFRAYPNKTIPAGSREKAWEQFQQHYPPNQKKSLWQPAKQVSKL